MGTGMGRIFYVKFQMCPLEFKAKYLVRVFKDVYVVQR